MERRWNGDGTANGGNSTHSEQRQNRDGTAMTRQIKRRGTTTVTLLCNV